MSNLICTKVQLSNNSVDRAFSELDALTQSLPHTIHQTRDWYKAYLETLGALERTCILQIYNNNGTLVGLLPLETHRKRGTRLWNHYELTILADGPTDFYTLLFDREYTALAAYAIVDWLLKNWSLWDQLNLSLIPAESDGWQDLVECMENERLRPKVDTQRGYFEVDTTQNWSDYYENFIVPNNKDLLKAMRRIERDGKRLQVTTIQKGIKNVLPDLLPIYGQRRATNDQIDKYASQAYQDFVYKVIQAYENNDQVELNILRDQDENVWAYQLDWIDKGIRYHYQHAYNEEFSRYSPGKVLLLEIMKQSFADENILRCNYMRGEAPYKKKLANIRNKYVHIQVVNPKSMRLRATRFASRIVRLRDALTRRNR